MLTDPPPVPWTFYLAIFFQILLVVGLVLFAYQLIRQLVRIAAALEHRTRDRAQNVQVANGDAPDQTTLRLQACERLTLMLERIAPPNLLLRHAPETGKNARTYTAELLLAVRQEVEYNVTQQIYVSDALWNIVTQARDNVAVLVTKANESSQTSQDVANRLRHLMGNQEHDPITLAQAAVRREAAGMLAKPQ